MFWPGLGGKKHVWGGPPGLIPYSEGRPSSGTQAGGGCRGVSHGKCQASYWLWCCSGQATGTPGGHYAPLKSMPWKLVILTQRLLNWSLAIPECVTPLQRRSLSAKRFITRLSCPASSFTTWISRLPTRGVRLLLACCLGNHLLGNHPDALHGVGKRVVPLAGSADCGGLSSGTPRSSPGPPFRRRRPEQDRVS